jgi:hypothetical protein
LFNAIPNSHNAARRQIRQKSCHVQVVVSAEISGRVTDALMKYWAKED